MPLRKMRLNPTLDNTSVRPRALAQTPGLTKSSKCVEISEASIKLKEISLPAVAEPDTDIIGSVEIVEEIPQPSPVPHGIGKSSKPSENAAPNAASKSTSQPKAITKADFPPELRPIVEAEQRRTAETAAKLALCPAVISGVEATLLPLTNDSNRQSVYSMRVHLLVAIAKYLASGLASTPPVLPHCPTNYVSRTSDARSTKFPAVPVLPVRST
ncbi:EKA-like protein [Blumeria hordei DH14]|uniref:EKA-like protein n=1 Tax=Blumeria graminis f. sp. hordei (strain DH14) TaxID=546991 RepID=N1JKS1_BLUG1|nr:EKA-like protein [Blumeria hordei DH14]